MRTLYEVDIDDTLFNLLCHDEERLIKLISIHVHIYPEHLQAKENVIQGASLSASIAKVLSNYIMPQPILLVDLMQLCKLICPSQLEHYEYELCRNQDERLSLADTVRAMWESIPSEDGTGTGLQICEALPSNDEQSIINYTSPYRLGERLEEVRNNIPEIVDGLEEYAFFKSQVISHVHTWSDILTKPELQMGTIDEHTKTLAVYSLRVQKMLLDLLTKKLTIVKVFSKQYEVSSAYAFLRKAYELAQRTDERLATAIRRQYPTIFFPQRQLNGISVEIGEPAHTNTTSP